MMDRLMSLAVIGGCYSELMSLPLMMGVF